VTRWDHRRREHRGEVLDDVTRPNWSANSEGDLFAVGYDNEVAIRIDSETLQITEIGDSPGNFKYGMVLPQ
jgi:hypothetical protein